MIEFLFKSTIMALLTYKGERIEKIIVGGIIKDAYPFIISHADSKDNKGNIIKIKNHSHDFQK